MEPFQHQLMSMLELSGSRTGDNRQQPLLGSRRQKLWEVKQDPERDWRRFPEAGAPAGEERGIRTRSAGKGRPTPTADPGDAASRPRFPSWRPPGVPVPGCHLDARGWGGRAGRAGRRALAAAAGAGRGVGRGAGGGGRRPAGRPAT
ncbi:hypothetical protein J1605_018033 [Eschrichtius robustus]|uniref:Uncharacterized protein n=1 Tax=Eschrichtius robustus TaxID=9764 RepID=A0AB34HZA6_ESCRO|nr:hypothetical protein J1605_018033 [Eschrichtius robustus]